jgi:hypothetical protein
MVGVKIQYLAGGRPPASTVSYRAERDLALSNTLKEAILVPTGIPGMSVKGKPLIQSRWSTLPSLYTAGKL